MNASILILGAGEIIMTEPIQLNITEMDDDCDYSQYPGDTLIVLDHDDVTDYEAFWDSIDEE